MTAPSKICPTRSPSIQGRRRRTTNAAESKRARENSIARSATARKRSPSTRRLPSRTSKELEHSNAVETSTKRAAGYSKAQQLDAKLVRPATFVAGIGTGAFAPTAGVASGGV